MLNEIDFNKSGLQGSEIDETLFEAALKDFRRDGYIILKGVFSKDYISTLYHNFMHHYSRYFINENHADALTVGDKRFQISVEIKEVFNSPMLYANTHVIEFMKFIFDNWFIISDLTCVTSLPGAKRMRAHRDGRIFVGHPLSYLLPPHAVGALIPLIPFNKLNGTTRVWPGTHRGEDPQDESSKLNFVDLEIDTGSCILMDYRVLHGGNPNHSEEIRPLLYINYSAPWYYDPLNFHKQAPLILDDANFEQIPNEYKKLFVRRQIKPNRGHLLKGQEK